MNKTLLIFFKIISFIVPLIITCAIFFILNKKPDLENSNEVVAEVAGVNAEALDNWYKNKSTILKNEFFINLKIKKDEKIISFKDLDNKKQEVFKLMLFAKTKKDCETALMNKDYMENEQYKQLNKFGKDLNEKIIDQKKILYNLYGLTMHPLDKQFLELYDVHLLN
jgi:hypothetical protein